MIGMHIRKSIEISYIIIITFSYYFVVVVAVATTVDAIADWLCTIVVVASGWLWYYLSNDKNDKIFFFVHWNYYFLHPVCQNKLLKKNWSIQERKIYLFIFWKRWIIVIMIIINDSRSYETRNNKTARL